MGIERKNLKLLASNLTVLSLAHALVDCTCAAVVLSLIFSAHIGPEESLNLIILYNLLAFGFQPLFGWISDKWRRPRPYAIIGCGLTASSALVYGFSPYLCVILAGVGNALFHLGAGTISLNLTPTRATAPGIFVSLGAAGLLVGTLLGGSGWFMPWPFVGALLVLCAAMLALKIPDIMYDKSQLAPSGSPEVVIILLLLAVAVRSFVGASLIFPWKADRTLLYALTLAVVGGKALGGLLADRYGWIKIGVGSLVLSAPLLMLGPTQPGLAITGMFLFNMTMPITLVAVSNTMPGRPGLAFGLTCLALFIGAIPPLIGLKGLLNSQPIILAVILASAAAIYLGLKIGNYKK